MQRGMWFFCLKVLSKEEHVCWWAVRALKTGSVGFVPASFLNHVLENVTSDTASQVNFKYLITHSRNAV
jgi:hypothetical protein